MLLRANITKALLATHTQCVQEQIYVWNVSHLQFALEVNALNVKILGQFLVPPAQCGIVLFSVGQGEVLASDGLAQRAVIEVQSSLATLTKWPEEGSQRSVHLRPLEGRQLNELAFLLTTMI